MEHRCGSNIAAQGFGIGYFQPHTGITAEHSCIHKGRALAPEIGSSFYPMENISTHRLYSAAQQDLDFMPFGHSSSSFLFKGPNVQAPVSWQSYQNFQQFPAGGRFYASPENNFIHISSGHSNWRAVDKVESGLLDHIQEAGREFHKRKRPEISVACERGSTSRYYNVGCSSSAFKFQIAQPTSGYQNHPSSYISLPQYMDCGLLIDNGDPSRNVRGRYGLDLEINPRRTYPSNYFSHRYFSTAHNHFGAMDVTCLNSGATTYDLNHFSAFSAAHGRFQTSGSFGARHEMNQNSARGVANDVFGYRHDYYSNRNPFLPPSHLQPLRAQVPRDYCNSHSRRTIPSTPHTGQGSACLENITQFPNTSFSSRSSWPFSAGGWHNNHLNTRARAAGERFQSLSNAVGANACDQMGSEAQMMVNRSFSYASRNLFDQYRDLRLDIDNLSYEELLSLGERIGNVSTGLSKDVISKCLAKTTHYSLDENKKERTCAICLEEYKEEEEIGIVKNCGHDYHVGCIEKWLSVKNACPVCQGLALAESLKED